MGFNSELASIKNWPERMADWMTDNFILDPAGQKSYLAERSEKRAAYEKQRQERLEREASAAAQSTSQNTVPPTAK
jgi:hypothetical protein